MLLAIDTSTSLIGAACVDLDQIIDEVVVEDARRHGELLAPTIVQTLATAGIHRSELTRIAVGVGPGPFTGLRVGITTGLVMGRALGIPVVGVCSLDALAWAVHEDLVSSEKGDALDPQQVSDAHLAIPEFLVATDARRKEVYWARYARTARTVQRIGEPGVTKPAELPSHLRGLPTYGRGAMLYPEVLLARSGHPDVRPGALGRCAHRRSWLRRPEPMYLRRPDAVPSLVATTKRAR